MGNALSLFNFIKVGGYDASLITTYAINFQLYEQLVLRRLISNGCRYNVLAIDHRQLATAWTAKELRPVAAGAAYTLFPVVAPGVFHPKIWFLAGRKKAALFIGSHNMTFGGLGYNQEVTTLLELDREPDNELDGVCRDAWNAVRVWVQRCDAKMPHKVVDAVYRFEEFLRPFLRPPKKDAAVRFHSQGISEHSLFDEYGSGVGDDIERIAVLGPYLDSRLEFLQSLRKRWPSAKICVGITPEALDNRDLLAVPHYCCVDARLIGGKDRHGFVHAKALYIEGSRGERVLAVGSANPSAPAWIHGKAGANAEAMLIWRGRLAQQKSEELGIKRIFDLPRLKPDSFDLSQWSQHETAADDTAVPSPIGVAQIDQRSRTIEFILDSKSEMTRYALCTSTDMVLHEAQFSCRGLVRIQVPDLVKLSDVRSVAIYDDDGLVLTVWIHDVEEIENLASSSVKVQVKKALCSLTSDEGNLAEVLDAVQKVIFEDEQEFLVSRVASAIRQNNKSIDREAVQPDSLAVDAASIERRSPRIRVLRTGDLAYLIDVLMRRLAIDSKSNDSWDRLGRSEEEQIGTDDSAPESVNGSVTFAENELATAIGRKVKNLVRRLAQYLESAANDDDRTGKAVARVIAVLALVRELRRIESLPRWRIACLELVPYEPRAALYTLSVEYLLGEKFALLRKFEHAAGARTEERNQAQSLLAWLAWDIGDEYTERFPLSLEPEEIELKLLANASLFEILPSLVSDDGNMTEAKDSFRLTRPIALRARERQQAWLAKHMRLGGLWNRLKSEPLESFLTKDRLELGDIAIVTTAENPKPRIVVEIGDGHIGLSTLDSVVRFQRNRVSGIRV